MSQAGELSLSPMLLIQVNYAKQSFSNQSDMEVNMSVVQRVDFANKQLLPDKPEATVADLDNGYLRIANQVQDALCRLEISGREWRVLNAIIRLTWGWSKKEDRITNSLIADKTELSVKHVSEAVLSLEERRIISLRRIGQTRYIGINTELNQWAYKKPKCKSCLKNIASLEEQITFLIEIAIPENGDSKKGAKTIPEKEDNYPRKQGYPSPFSGNTKDIISNTENNIKTTIVPKNKKSKFDANQVEIPEWLNPSVWHEWVSYRQQIGKSIKTVLTVTKAFNILKECFDDGHDPADVINTSIANGWQGLFKPKYPAKRPLAGQSGPHWNNREEWEEEFI